MNADTSKRFPCLTCYFIVLIIFKDITSLVEMHYVFCICLCIVVSLQKCRLCTDRAQTMQQSRAIWSSNWKDSTSTHSESWGTRKRLTLRTPRPTRGYYSHMHIHKPNLKLVIIITTLLRSTHASPAGVIYVQAHCNLQLFYWCQKIRTFPTVSCYYWICS